MLKKYIIERTMPGVGESSAGEFGQIAENSNEAVDALGTKIHWQESYVTNDKIFCVYLAENEEIIREHARKSGFPVDHISEVKKIIDPSNAVLADLPYYPKDELDDNFVI